jgi:hypothetical protein
MGGRMAEQDEDAPSPMQADKRRSQATLYDGPAHVRESDFLDDLLAWAGAGEIYAVGTEDELARLLPGVASRAIEIVKRIPTPSQAATADDEPRGRPGRGGPGGGMADAARDRRRGPGGMMGVLIEPGEEIVVARWR